MELLKKLQTKIHLVENFVALNGIAIKSHGGTDAFGFASAIEVGYDMARSNVLERLAADLEALHGKLGQAEAARGSS